MPEKIAGESTTSKILRIRENLLAKGATCHLVGTLDDIAWTFNIRGTDISYNPVVISYAFITMETAILFIDKTKLTDSVMEKFRAEDVEIRDYFEIFTFLRKLDEKNKILIDNNKISQKLRDAIPDGCEILEDMNISAELKTVKNSIELKGFINAHLRDGAAMVKWLYWLETHLGKIAMDEVSVAEKLEDIRSSMNHYKGLSFSTIVGYKENGAIVHYTAKKETAAKIQPEGLLLVDSGAQYEDGTTDITRTISLGGTTAEEKDAFTSVLKGHINLARAIFPKGYTGAKIDTFARGPIWEKLYNYGHGTGHGIGHYLNVHEGPQQIRPTNHYEIKAGMVNSNEPGMYLEGKFGIRIENLIVAREKESNEYGTFLTFDTITLCPIDLSLIDQKRLNDDEKTWLNEYHEKVRNELQPLLADEENEWLMKKTEAI
jgi:Xaa-Pro aminopeptidase